MLKRKVLVLAKVEAVYGVDAAPVPATDSIRTGLDVSVKPTGEELVRDFADPSLSPLPHLIGEKYAEAKFSTEIKGSGAAGTAPEIGVLFKGCGFAETIVPATSAAYDPVSASEQSLTIWVYRDGLLHKLTGCRGTGEVDLSVGKYGVINWTFQGLYVDPIDSALLSGTYNVTQPPVVLSAAFSIGAYSAVATKLALSMANELAFRRDMNSAAGIREIVITGRPDRGGSFDPEAVLEATHPFWANWKSAVQAALSVTVGSVAGNRCVITGPKAQIKSIGYADRDGILTYEIPFRLARNLGDDEVKFLFN